MLGQLKVGELLSLDAIVKLSHSPRPSELERTGSMHKQWLSRCRQWSKIERLNIDWLILLYKSSSAHSSPQIPVPLPLPCLRFEVRLDRTYILGSVSWNHTTSWVRHLTACCLPASWIAFASGWIRRIQYPASRRTTVRAPWRVVCSTSGQAAPSDSGGTPDAKTIHLRSQTQRELQLRDAPPNQSRRVRIEPRSCAYVWGRVEWGRLLQPDLITEHPKMTRVWKG